MNHAIEALLQLDESAVAGEVADLASETGARGIFLRGFVPGVGFELAQAQGDFLLVTVDAEHDGFNLLVGFEHVRRLGDAFGPGEFGDVDQAFDARLEFDKGAIRHEVDDPAFDAGADRILLFDGVPGVGQLLLKAQADALLFAVDVQDNDINVLADFENL